MNGKVIVMTIILSLGFVNSNAFSYLFEDTIYIEIYSLSIDKKEIEEIKAILIKKANDDNDLKYLDNYKKADYAYKIIIELNKISIINLITNKKAIKRNINTKAKRIKFLENYIFTDYKIENEYEIFLNEFNLSFGILALGAEQYSNFGISVGISYELAFLRFDLEQVIAGNRKWIYSI